MSFLDQRFSNPRYRRYVRLLIWLGTLGYFAFAAILLLLRYAILPQIENYRGDLEQALSGALHLPVSIGKVDANWQGLRPHLDLRNFSIHDQAGRPALSFEHVEAVLGWRSLLFLEPRLHRLQVLAPNLEMRRDRAGRLFVAGLEVDTRDSKGGFADWLLKQDEIVVTNATVTWTDELRGAPPLSLSQLDFRLDNSLRRHRFGLNFVPPPNLASRLDVRGDLHGRDPHDLDSWTGQFYASVDRIDLAVWRNWIDYPIELPQGYGGLRFWLDFAELRPTALTADVALRQTRIRLARELPELDLERINGRVQVKRQEDGFSASVGELSLATREGLRMQPMDASFSWTGHEGDISARNLDLSSLNRIAAYLPLPAEIRNPLTAYAPGGKVHDLKLRWSNGEKPFEKWQLGGRFENLHLAAQGKLPGFSGFSGKLEGDEGSGTFELTGREATLDLPAVFPEPRLLLAALDASATWKRAADGMEFHIARASFSNRDAEGSASGSYTWRPGHTGDIDLEAKLTRGDGSAVWRYMPLVVSKDARDFLQKGIQGGAVDEATLKLKGDLDRFPFSDHSGVFEVKGRFHGPTLHYADSWPEILDITGQILFDGPRMTVEASAGRMLGANVGPVKAEIANLEAPEELLTVSGKAAGPTAEFLKFIEASPVGDRIDRFTTEMSANGNGELDLKLALPLRNMDKSSVAGSYRFDGNRLLPDPALPALDDVRGRIEFSATELGARDVRARVLGGAARIDVKTAQDGMVQVSAAGDASIAQLRQQYPNPVFEHLSGSTRWNGVIKVRHKNVEFRFASNLQGVTSSLPDPFNKTAGDAMPLVLERKQVELPRPPAKRAAPPTPPTTRDQIELTLGKVARAQLLRRPDGTSSVIERGIIAVGDLTPKAPERGVLLAVNLPRLDADFWRSAINSAANAGTAKGSAGLAITQFDLRAAECRSFGHTLHEFHVAGTKPAATWGLDLKSREVAGKLEWADGGAGKLSGRITQFSLTESPPGAEPAPSGEAFSELPNLDLVFDRFVMHGKDFGQVKIAAENKGGYWDAGISAQTEDASLTGQGKWRPDSGAPDTHFDFRLKTKSIEKTLARVGYPGAVRRGNATVEGNLSWKGVPFDIDYATLDGSLKLDARDGQFNKLDPTVVGRLLGVISLQSLPRRISLDFRDVFSEGFAFDAITAQAGVRQGVLETKDMEIRGPAAKVQMAGKVNLVRETQDLKVRVQPALGESVATGVLLANPAVGATTWVLNKLFGNPLDKAFAYDFAVTGNWADPKVEKLAAQAPVKQGSQE